MKQLKIIFIEVIRLLLVITVVTTCMWLYNSDLIHYSDITIQMVILYLALIFVIHQAFSTNFMSAGILTYIILALTFYFLFSFMLNELNIVEWNNTFKVMYVIGAIPSLRIVFED